MRHAMRGFVLAGVCALPFPALAQDDPSAEQVVHGPLPDWAVVSEPLPVPDDTAGLMFVRQQDALIHLDDHGQSAFVGQRVVLLHPQALQLGNVGFVWNPAVGKPVVHALRIHRGEETIDVLESARFEVLRREDQLEQAMLTGTLTAVLRVPDLRVGDELELAYTIPTADPVLRDLSAAFLALGPTPLPGRYRLGLSWVDGQEPRIQATGDLSDMMTRTGNAIDIRVDNPPALVPPADAPPRYAWQRIIELSDFTSWAALSQRFASLYAEASRLSDDSPLKREVARIAGAEMTQMARAQAALALVQQQVRYIYVGLDGGNYRPATADETWQRRYGDCKGKTALLLALLGELGIEAEPVLARNNGPDDGTDARLPNPGLFDHVLVRATIDGRAYWLDGTLPVVATAHTETDFPYRWVLPLVPGGSELEHIPWRIPSKPDEIDLYEIDARAGLDEPARIVTTSIKRGPGALVEYLQFSAFTPSQLLQAFRGTLTGESSFTSIDSVTYRYDAEQRASVVEIVGVGPVNWDSDDDDGSRSLALPGGGFSPPGRRQRGADQDRSAPFYNAPSFNCNVTTLRVPEDTPLTNWSNNSTFDARYFGELYYRAFDQRDGSIRMVRGHRTEQVEISPDHAEADNGRLSRFDNSMAWVTYRPAASGSSGSASVAVPATYEGNWVENAKACLPPNLRDGA